MFALSISMPRCKRIIFYQSRPKIKLFMQKNAKFLSAGGSATRFQCLHELGLCPDTRNGLYPQTPKQPPNANFWLRAWVMLTIYVIRIVEDQRVVSSLSWKSPARLTTLGSIAMVNHYLIRIRLFREEGPRKYQTFLSIIHYPHFLTHLLYRLR